MKLKFVTLAALLATCILKVAAVDTSSTDIKPIDLDAIPKGDTIEYQAQTSRLMNLIVHSMYVNKEVFIRELLANACDAIDKLKRKAFGNAELTKEVSENSRVIVTVDQAAGTITFRDTGIGMTRDELKDYLGTIAKSGTSELMSKLKESKDASSLIGQFGVGFYSVFLVGDRVAVASKSDDDAKQWVWSSSADSPGFTIVEDPRGVTMRRGTEITIKLKPEESKFLDEQEVKQHMQTYATYYPYPIYIQLHKTVEKEVEETEDSNAPKVEDAEESEKPKKTITEQITEDYHVNSQKPLWLRDPKTVTKEEYAKMYQTVFKTTEEPLAYIQFAVEGDVSYKGILFVPKRSPFDVYSLKDAKPDVHLYVRRSFVTDKIEDILPTTLSFVKGVVDSDDLPLNISRETLQNTVALRSIKAKVVSKAIEMFKEIIENEDLGKTFYEQYSNHIKLEIARRENLRAKLAPLLRFQSNKSDGDKMVSLDKYVEGKKEGQKAIYYIAGSSKKEVEKSPFMERLNEKDLQVLYALDPIDEQTLKALTKYHDLPFQSIAQEGFTLDESEDEKATKTALEAEYKPLTEWLKKTLSRDVDKIVISNKLVKSAFAVVASQFGFTGHMEKLYLSQQQGGKQDPMMQFFMSQKKTLEINPQHQTVKMLLSAVSKDPESKSEDDLKTIAKALYDSALLASGFTLHVPQHFAATVEKMAFKVLGHDYVEPPKETETPDMDDIMQQMQEDKDERLDDFTDKDVEESPKSDVNVEETSKDGVEEVSKEEL